MNDFDFRKYQIIKACKEFPNIKFSDAALIADAFDVKTNDICSQLPYFLECFNLEEKYELGIFQEIVEYTRENMNWDVYANISTETHSLYLKYMEYDTLNTGKYTEGETFAHSDNVKLWFKFIRTSFHDIVKTGVDVLDVDGLDPRTSVKVYNILNKCDLIPTSKKIKKLIKSEFKDALGLELHEIMELQNVFNHTEYESVPIRSFRFNDSLFHKIIMDFIYTPTQLIEAFGTNQLSEKYTKDDIQEISSKLETLFPRSLKFVRDKGSNKTE